MPRVPRTGRSMIALAVAALSATACGEPVTYDVVVKTGDPVEEIIREADEGEYDLVVIGEHSGGRISDALKRKVGSTAWRILHRCKKPILVVRLPFGHE